jgi:hypothetical protein
MTEKYKYKNNKASPTGSFLVKSTGEVQLISGFQSSDNNQIVTWGQENGSLNSVGLQELLDNWDPNPRYICIVSPSAPEKRPFDEKLIEGDLWYDPVEQKQYTWVTLPNAAEPDWIESSREPEGFTGSVIIPNGLTTTSTKMNYENGLLKTVEIIDNSNLP